MFKNFLVVVAILVSVLSARAAQQAMISIDGAMVYKGASFDSPVIAYLKKGKKVKISSKNYGPFYRVLLRRGLVGYVSDIDIKIFGGGKKKKRRKKRSRRSRKKSRDGGDEDDFGIEDDVSDEGDGDDSDQWSRTSDHKDRRSKKKPVFARKYIGANAGIMNFKEEILAQAVAANVTTIGVKATGPNLLMEGPYIFDVNLYVGLGAPAYYAELSQTAPSGLLFIIDANLIFPYHAPTHEKWAMYFGAGPVIVYSKFEITLNDTVLDLQDLKLGASFMAGFSYEIGKDYILKLEPKYFVEKNSYFGVFTSFQKEF